MERRSDEANKGELGQFIEEHVFGYDTNSDDSPDFIDAGIELKVTPVIQLKSGEFSSKERLVLNIINYVEEGDKDFESSSFYKKNRRLLIMFYLYRKGMSEADYEITANDIYEFEHSPDFVTIKRDWEIIHEKIAAGKAHEISESDTTFLAACTKGAKGSDLRTQYHSSVPAKPRAYSFKCGFMTRLYREIIHGAAPYLSFVSEDEWLKNPLEEVFKEKLSIYYGKSVEELKYLLSVNSKAKQLLSMLAQAMLGLSIHKRIYQTQEMVDAGIKPKTVHLDKKGKPTESMSFPAFDFTELITVPWEDSSIRDDMCEWKIMLFVFRDDDKGVCRFERVLFWNIPNSVVDGKVKDMYENAAKMIVEGDAFEFDAKGKVVDKFPKEDRRSNGCCHIRPHGRDGKDKIALPTPDKKTGILEFVKPSFWFNSQYVGSVVAELIALED